MGVYATIRQQVGIGLLGRAIGRVDTIFVHTEAGATMPVGSTLSQERQRMKAIHRFHKSLGWSGYGYSAGVAPRSKAGRIHEGRGFRRSGAHTKGYNSRSLAICCFGHGDRHGITSGALQGIRNWIGEGVALGHISPNPTIRGHRDVSSKSCPGNKIYPRIGKLRGVTGRESGDYIDSEPLPPKVPEEVDEDMIVHGQKGKHVAQFQHILNRCIYESAAAGGNIPLEGGGSKYEIDGRSGSHLKVDGHFGDTTRNFVHHAIRRAENWYDFPLYHYDDNEVTSIEQQAILEYTRHIYAYNNKSK